MKKIYPFALRSGEFRVFHSKVPRNAANLITKSLICILMHLSFVQMTMGFSPVAAGENIKLSYLVTNTANKHALRDDFTSLQADIRVSGIVTDDTGEALPGATVAAAGTTLGTVTDINGAYAITVPDDATLIFSFIGFQTQRVAVGNRTQINITLQAELSALDEIVVVGYGTQKKINLTGAVSTARGEDMANRPVTNVQQAL